MAQSLARRVNFWNDHAGPAGFGTRISVSSSSGAERGLEEAREEVAGGDLARCRPGRATTSVASEREQRRRQVGRRVAVRERAADRAAVADLRVADLRRRRAPAAGRSAAEQLGVSTSWWRVSAPIAMWSPSSRT